MKFEELPKKKLEVIKSILLGSPNLVSVYPWLSIYPCKPEDIFDNPNLLDKVVAAAIVTSGAILYSLDIVRRDGNVLDVDRHLLSTFGAIIFRRREIEKDFPEHHSSELPSYYNPICK